MHNGKEAKCSADKRAGIEVHGENNHRARQKTVVQKKRRNRQELKQNGSPCVFPCYFSSCRRTHHVGVEVAWETTGMLACHPPRSALREYSVSWLLALLPFHRCSRGNSFPVFSLPLCACLRNEEARSRKDEGGRCGEARSTKKKDEKKGVDALEA